jgi:hypothetical protein
MGENYDDRIYYSFSRGVVRTIRNDRFDLAFDNQTVWLNEGQIMLALHTGQRNFATPVDPLAPGLPWVPDASSGAPDSTFVGLWQRDFDDQGRGWVYIIDRGRVYHNNSPNRFWRFQLLRPDDGTTWRFRLAPLTAPDTGATWILAKPTAPGERRFIRCEQPSQPLDVAPPPTDWDVVFTRYTHVFASEPVGSPARNYSVTGVLLNPVHGWQVAQTNTTAWDSLQTLAHLLSLNLTWTPNLDAIGYDWKVYDFDRGFIIRPDRVYFLKKGDDVYKLRFVAFLDDLGVKGAPSFLYQRLKP